MAAPGFSVSDLVKGIELVKDVVDSLQQSGQAKEEHRQLLFQLHALEAVYIEIKDLIAETPRGAQDRVLPVTQVLEFTVTQCQDTIDRFWAKNRKYQNLSARRPHGLKDGLKDRWRTVIWALYKKEEVEAFRVNLGLYTGQIQMLLSIDER